MKQMFDSFSGECSKLITRRYSTSFSLGIRLLDAELRQPVYAIYGFVRLADEIVDSFHDYDKERLLGKLKEDCFIAISERISTNPIINTFQETVNRYSIDIQLIIQFFNSMEMDLKDISYDEEHYNEYILGSAEVVGLMCLYVFTSGVDEQFQYLKPKAMRLGAAFQKVNFLRDIGSDYTLLKRTYFPQINLKEFNDSDKQKIEEDIEADFEIAMEGIRQLPQSCRRGVYLAYQYYRQLFKKIKGVQACSIFHNRYRLSWRRKFVLLLEMLIKHKLNRI